MEKSAIKDRLQKYYPSIGIILIWIFVYFIMVFLGYLIDVPGSDWYHHWEPRYEIDSYPPWVNILLDMLPGLPFLSGLTLTIMLFVLWRRKANIWHFLAVFTSMPLYWTLWLGQVDAVPILGLALLPWGIPLVLLKPQVAIWYAWVWWKKRPDKWVIALGWALFVLLTFVIWGFWPLNFSNPAAFRTVYDLSLWQFHWLFGVIVIAGALLESDPERAMALGALGALYIQGASYIVLLPTLTRFSGMSLLIIWLTTWAGAASIFLGDSARPLATLFPISIWISLFLREHLKGRVDGNLETQSEEYPSGHESQ